MSLSTLLCLANGWRLTGRRQCLHHNRWSNDLFRVQPLVRPA
ncbi:hypothetical protein [Chroococcidiopsis sp.]